MNYVPKIRGVSDSYRLSTGRSFSIVPTYGIFILWTNLSPAVESPLNYFFRKRNANWFIRSRRATQSFTFLPSGENGETEFSTEFIQGPFNDTMTDEEAHRLLSSGRTRSLPSIQRVIDRKEKQIAKKKANGKSKLSVQDDRFTKLWILFPKNRR